MLKPDPTKLPRSTTLVKNKRLYINICLNFCVRVMKKNTLLFISLGIDQTASCTMVLISDGNSEQIMHVWRKWKKYFQNCDGCQTKQTFQGDHITLHTCAPISELPSNISTMVLHTTYFLHGLSSQTKTNFPNGAYHLNIYLIYKFRV